MALPDRRTCRCVIEQLRDLVTADLKNWSRLIRDAGIKGD